jgi:hypothetical protein
MKPLKWMWLAAASLVIASPLFASDGQGDVVADEPARVEVNLFHAPVRLEAADGVIDSGPSWGHSSPWIEDVDGDGVKDLIVGDFSGLYRLYRNEGANQAPRYAKSVNLQAGGVDAKVPIY